MATNHLSAALGDVQFKVCSKCAERSPATREFFSLDGSDPHRQRLRAICKSCNRTQTAAWRRANPGKVLAQKEAVKEATKWTPDGEHRYPLRRCTKCSAVFPNNPDHFSRQSRGDGLAAWCKACSAAAHVADRPARNAKTRANYAKLRQDDPAKIKEWRDDWRTKNRDRYNALMRAGKARRRARIAKAGGSFSADDIARLLKAQKGRCWWCGCSLTAYHVDHRIPLAKGGSNGVENLVISCPDCNFRKNDKMPWEWAHSRLL